MRTVDKAEDGIKYSLTQMWQLVAKQVADVRVALVEHDTELANEILLRERIIDNYELQIDKRCEQFTALQSPVAVDLRFVLSHLKMNSNLERIADLSEGVALFVINNQSSTIADGKFQIGVMLDNVLRMLELAYQSYMSNDTDLAMKILSMDRKVDLSFEKAMEEIVNEIVGADKDKVEEMLGLSLAIRRVERMGDRCTNLAENIIFHIDAKELKHSDNIPLFDTL